MCNLCMKTHLGVMEKMIRPVPPTPGNLPVSGLHMNPDRAAACSDGGNGPM